MVLRPDGAATVQYSGRVTWRDGRRTREVLAATTGSRIPDGAAVRETDVDGTRVALGVWRWPLDPALPALAWAASAARVSARLQELGLATGPVRLRLRSNRPGRRAVVQATTSTGTRYLKVVRPAAVGRMVERHAVLSGAVPVPPLLATTDDGVLVLPGLPGTPMRALLAGGGRGLPDAAELDRLLDALPPEAAGVRTAGRRPTGDALARVADHAAVLAHLVLLEHVLPDAATAARYRREPDAHALRRWPAGRLRPRIAAALVGLATGPFRVQQADWPAGAAARLALAEEWAGIAPAG